MAQVIPLLRKCSLAGHAEFKTQDEVCLRNTVTGRQNNHTCGGNVATSRCMVTCSLNWASAQLEGAAICRAFRLSLLQLIRSLVSKQ